MAACNTLNAFTVDTPKNMQLDSGVLLKNVALDKTMDDAAIRAAITAALADKTKHIGATSDSGSFTHTPEFRDIFEDVNGARGKIKGGYAISSTETMMTVTILEMTPANLAMALGSADITGNMIVPRTCVEDSDYISSVTWVGGMNNNQGLLVIHMTNVMNTNGLSYNFEDNANGTVELELSPFIDLATPDELPLFITVLPEL